ncbi:hypothetical protein ABPG77_010528 [Micractinium sp. CCAP 211/92]
MTTEFTIRAAGADRVSMKHLVCRFPLAFRPDPASESTANAPDLKRPGESWAMGQMEEVEARPGTRGLPGQWVLEEQSGRPRFVGQPEGGLRDTGAGYFLLMKGKGNEFIAVPVSEVFTFKPALQRKHQSLEEAEAAMHAQRLQHERANPRLARAVARDEDDPLSMLRDEEEADSDEEWKGIKERAAARHEVKTAPQAQQRQQQQKKRAAEDEERPEEDHAERSDKGEDWEHEDVAADDDLDMGEGEEEEVAGSPTRRPGASSDSEEEGVAAKLAPEKTKKRLRKMMRATGLEDSSEDEGSDEGEEESESIMDEEDLDRMAGPTGEGGPAGQAGGAAKAREPTPEAPLRAAAAEAAVGGKKRKSPTPPPAGILPPPAAAGAAEQGVKRPRTGAAASAATAAAAAAAEAAAAPAAAQRPAPAAAGTVTADELRQLLRSKGRILLADLTAMYKSRLTPEGQRQFVQLVKQVAKMEPGSKYLVLRE